MKHYRDSSKKHSSSCQIFSLSYPPAPFAVPHFLSHLSCSTFFLPSSPFINSTLCLISTFNTWMPGWKESTHSPFLPQMNFAILCGLDKAHRLEALVSPICSNELADSFMWRSTHWFERVSWMLVLVEWILPAVDCGLLKRRVRVNWSVEQTWRCRHFP